MKTITLDTIKAMNVSTFSAQDDSPRGIKTVTAEEIKPGDRVVIDNHFCEVVEAPEQEQAERNETVTYSVEIEPTGYADDLFNGTLDECIEYIKAHGYTGAEDSARIAKIQIDEDGTVSSTLDIITADYWEQDTEQAGQQDAPGRDTLGLIREYLDTLTDGDKVEIWNVYADATNNPDDRIYSMDEFDEVFSGVKPWEIARACFYSRRFNPSDDWFWINGYGNVESADYISECDDRNPIDLDAVAEYITLNDDELYNDDIRAILDGEGVRI